MAADDKLHKIVITLEDDDSCSIFAPGSMELQEVVDILQLALDATLERAEKNAASHQEFRKFEEDAKVLFPSLFQRKAAFKN